jgi:hypothetical protein
MKMTKTTEINEELNIFRNGSKAMFDYLLMRTANHYHGNPEIQKQCDYDNELIEQWATDALESVSHEDAIEWRSVSDAYNAGYKIGKQEK